MKTLVRITVLSAISIIYSFSTPAFAVVHPCPSEDSEPALEMTTSAGPTLEVCGFEDHEVKAPKGTRVFSDFAIYATPDKTPVKVFDAEDDETYYVRVNGERGLEVEELWFFNDKPIPAVRREITCVGDVCTASEPKCIYKLNKNAFPKAVATFTKKAKEGKLKEDGEELLDQIFVQTLAGDKAAKAFYEKPHEGLSPELIDVFETNKKKLSLVCPK